MLPILATGQALRSSIESTTIRSLANCGNLMAVYFKKSESGAVRYMASVGAGSDRERKTFRTEAAAGAWEATENARRQSVKTAAAMMPEGKCSNTDELGLVVDMFLRCDEDSQRLVLQLAGRPARSA